MTPRRVTFVAEQLLGYFRTGGLGTATTFLSVALARSGHDVEILFFGAKPAGDIDPEWTALYEGSGVRIREVPHLPAAVEPSYFTRMRDIERALRADPPDVVITQDLGAPAYSALRLRDLGLAFESTQFVVFCHGTRQWIANSARKIRVLPGALAVSRLEQAGVELADVAASPSAYMVEWMRTQGWQLPERTEVIPLVTRSAALDEAPPRAPAAEGCVERITFFGRLEERKGIRPFVAGLNALPPDMLAGVELEFLGRPTESFAPAVVEGLLSEAVRGSVRDVAFRTDLDQHEALERLARPGTLAVIPSLEDNSPNVVYECLERGIPFLAGAIGGTAELVAPEERDRVLFEPTSEGVRAALERVLAGEPVTPARPAFDFRIALERWSEVLAAEPNRSRARREPQIDVEAIVVQGSSGRCAHALDAQTYAGFRGHVHAATRRQGLERTAAPWVVFFGDADEPAPECIETLARAQAASGADVVTCALGLAGDETRERYFSGEPGGLGLLGNDYGTVALLRRESLEEIADVLDEPAVDPDWLLLAELSARDARIVSVPLPLVSTTRPPGSLARDPRDGVLVVERLERALPEDLRHLARLATGLAAQAPPSAPPSAGIMRRAARRLLRR